MRDDKHRGAEIVGSCHGLLCIWNMDRDLSLYLYNPTTQTHKMLPSLPINPPFNYDGMNFCFGFGYDSVSRDYKCVRILQTQNQSQVMVYSMKEGVWRKGPELPYYFIHPKLCASALVDEAVHWLGESRERRQLPIVGLRLRDETFRTIGLPPPLVNGNGEDDELVGSMYLGALEERLCVSVNYFDHYEVWVMEEYGMVETWARRYTVQKAGDGYDILERPICYTASRKELVYRLVRLAVVSISMQTLESRPVQVAGFNLCWDAHPCVDNLLTLPGRCQPTMN